MSESTSGLLDRVLYSLSLPAVRVARHFRIPLKRITSLIELAYYHDLRRAGLSQKEMAAHLGVSLRKIGQLAAGLRDHFHDPEVAEELPRRIEFLLWAGAMSEGRIAQAFEGHTRGEIDDALAGLVESGRVVREMRRTPYYRTARMESSWFRDKLKARIDGLNNHLLNLTDGVLASFFYREAQPSFARTLDFRISPDRLDELEALYKEVLFPRLKAMDAEAHENEERIDIGLSFHWAPHGLNERIGGTRLSDDETRDGTDG